MDRDASECDHDSHEAPYWDCCLRRRGDHLEHPCAHFFLRGSCSANRTLQPRWRLLYFSSLSSGWDLTIDRTEHHLHASALVTMSGPNSLQDFQPLPSHAHALSISREPLVDCEMWCGCWAKLAVGAVVCLLLARPWSAVSSSGICACHVCCSMGQQKLHKERMVLCLLMLVVFVAHCK